MFLFPKDSLIIHPLLLPLKSCLNLRSHTIKTDQSLEILLFPTRHLSLKLSQHLTKVKEMDEEIQYHNLDETEKSQEKRTLKMSEEKKQQNEIRK